jgi:hypothetical protein
MRLTIKASILWATVFALMGGAALAQQDEGPVLKPKSKSKPAAATLLVVCDLTCDWKLDGEAKGSIPAGESKKIAVTPGQHLIDAATQDGLDKFEKQMEVKSAAQSIALIELQPVRDARLRAEQEAQEKAAREQAARQQAEEQQRLAREQAARTANPSSGGARMKPGPGANPQGRPRAFVSLRTVEFVMFPQEACRGTLQLISGMVSFKVDNDETMKCRKREFSVARSEIKSFDYNTVVCTAYPTAFHLALTHLGNLNFCKADRPDVVDLFTALRGQ